MTMFLPFQLDRTVRIQARPDTVFTFFTDSERWASWWGAGSTIEPRVGGRMYIRHPNGIEAAGEVTEIAPSERIAFTYGFVSGQPIPAGSSRVTIRLEADGWATRLHLTHEFADSGVRDEHVQGWRFQLSLFGQVATSLVTAGAEGVVDEWFAAWSEADAAARTARLSRIAAADVRFSDKYSLLEGLDDLVPHITATQRFMPGLRLQRSGGVRHSQGSLLVEWRAVGDDGQPRGTGTNVFTVRGDGLIASVVGFWS
jgi:uncharacterized protein YndB with AHSA1/START domain